VLTGYRKIHYGKTGLIQSVGGFRETQGIKVKPKKGKDGRIDKKKKKKGTVPQNRAPGQRFEIIHKKKL